MKSRFLSKKKRSTLLLTSIIFQISFAQIQQDSVKANQLYDQGIEQKSAAQYEPAISSFNSAFDLYEKHLLWSKMLDVNNQIIAVYIDLAKYEEALAYVDNIEKYEEKLGSHPSIAQYYNAIGIATFRLSQPDEALVYFEKVLALRKKIFGEKHKDVAQMLNSLAAIRMLTGKFDEALVYLQDYKEMLDELGLQDDPMYGNYYNNTGYIYEQKGDYQKALTCYRESTAIDIKHLGEDSPRGITAYNNLGNALMSVGAYDQGLTYHEKALANGLKIFGEQHEFIARSYNNIGNIWEAKEEYQKAIFFHKKSIDTKIAVFGPRNLNVAVSYENLSSNYLKLGDLDSALINANKSLEIRFNFFGEDHPVVGDTYLDIANVFKERKSYEEELSYLEKALAIFKYQGERSGKVALIHNRIAESYYNQANLKQAMVEIEKAIVSNKLTEYEVKDLETEISLKDYYNHLHLFASLQHKALYLMKNGDSKNSIDTYLAASHLIDKIRKTYLNQSDKIWLISQSKKLYDQALNLCYTEYKKTGKSIFVDNAFYFSEKNKSIVLQESLNRQEARLLSNVPDSLIDKERELKIDLAYNRSKEIELILINADTAQLKFYKDKGFRLQRSIESLNEYLNTNYPNYNSIRYGVNAPNISDVQKALLDYNLIEFFEGDTSLFVFVINSERVKMYDLSSSKNVRSDVKNLQISSKEDDLAAFLNVSNKLYKSLVDPLDIDSESIIIIPDGQIWNVNFDLLVADKNAQSFKDASYMLRTHNISYAYSANILIDNISRNYKGQNECLAFSYEGTVGVGDQLSINKMRDESLADLPGTRKEIYAISNIVDGEYYYGDNASERNFKNNAHNFEILHLALHGEIDNQDPMNSKLYFTNTADSIEDNVLHAFEIYSMELNAEMAVLSACNTGIGQMVNGEGLMSLARSFTYAGCRSLVMSQWEVSDRVTPKLMQLFYKNLENGMTKSSALRNAKLSYLEESSLNTSSPYNWAALVVIGDNSSLEKSSSLMIILVVLGLVVVIIIIRRRLS